jgi:hypothetical protein
MAMQSHAGFGYLLWSREKACLCAIGQCAECAYAPQATVQSLVMCYGPECKIMHHTTFIQFHSKPCHILQRNSEAKIVHINIHYYSRPTPSMLETSPYTKIDSGLWATTQNEMRMLIHNLRNSKSNS